MLTYYIPFRTIFVDWNFLVLHVRHIAAITWVRSKCSDLIGPAATHAAIRAKSKQNVSHEVQEKVGGHISVRNGCNYLAFHLKRDIFWEMNLLRILWDYNGFDWWLISNILDVILSEGWFQFPAFLFLCSRRPLAGQLGFSRINFPLGEHQW